MAATVRGAVTQEMDTGVLFEKFTIEEIRDIEKKTRADIEKKKEDLRQMVGERYRDLIEAADTISEMTVSAQNVMESITRMQELCQGMKQLGHIRSDHLTPAKHKIRRKDDYEYYEIATQIKLLHDMPEKIWTCLDEEALLRATQLFLLARHVHTSLQLDSAQSARVRAQFPVLATQWAAIGHFRATILQQCRETLKAAQIPDQLAAECVCSILLLEDSTPRQVFADLLVLRASAIQQLFQPEQSEVSIKQQVCDVVRMLMSAIHQVYAIFYSPEEGEQHQANVPCNLLMTTLERVMSKGEEGMILKDFGRSVSSKYLLTSVKDFRPSLKHHALPVSQKNLQQNCQQWIHTCSQNIESGLLKLLGYITTVKGLAAIRDDVWHVMGQDENLKTWEYVCGKVLNKPLPIWEQVFQQHFLNRTQAILHGWFDTALSSCKTQIGKVLQDLGSNEKYVEMEKNLSLYVWVEGSQDVAAHAAWIPAASRAMGEAGGLSMKAKAYTPAVQGLCRTFDGKLKVLLEDGAHYLKPASTQTPGADGGPFNKYADNDNILNFLQTTSKDCVEKLLEHLRQQLYACKQQLSNSRDHHGNAVIINRVLMLARFSASLGELCQHLQQCMVGQNPNQDLTRLTTTKKSSKSKGGDETEWSRLRSSLQQFSEEASRVWSDHLTQLLSSQFSAALLDTSGSAILLSTTRWDVVEIQEETEEGQTVKSTIRVPMLTSWYVQSLLFHLCEEINRVGGHALTRSVLNGIVSQLSDGLVSSYERLLKEHSAGLTQARALQLMFDVKFISMVLPRKDETKENKKYQSRVRAVIDKLEGKVDPFDLDVFSPYMQSHLNRQTQRCQVLYGALTALDRHGMFMSSKTSGGSQQEQHNVLPLTTSQNRFPLLPLSSQTRTSLVTPIVQPPKPSRGSSSEPLSPPPVMTRSQDSMSSSFLGQMSTIWFSNVNK